MKKKEQGMDIVDLWKYRRKEALGVMALTALLACVNGCAGAKVITAMIKEVQKKRKSEKFIPDIDDGYCKLMLQRMRADGLVENTERGIWGVTERGRQFLDFISKKNEKPVPASRAESDTIVVFDVPEKKRENRAQLRFELAARGFSSLQKSVWIGKGPFDRKFMAFLKSANLAKTVHIFTIEKRGTLRT